MACDFLPVGVGESACAENYAGTGTTAYLFKGADVDTSKLDVDETKNKYIGFALKEGAKIYPVKLKNQANKVVGASLGKNKGFSNTGTLVVERDLDVAAVCARTMNNTNFGILLLRPGIKAGCYILWNPTADPTFELSDDTGDTFNSDNQATWTVTSSPMPYSRMWISQDEFDALTVAEPTTEDEGSEA